MGSEEAGKKISTVPTIEMEYIKGESSIRTGIKKGVEQSGHVNGQRILRHGNGSPRVEDIRRRFILKIRVGDVVYSVWTEQVFKNLLGWKNLSEGRFRQIASTMPAQVEVEERESREGSVYYVLTENCATAWTHQI